MNSILDKIVQFTSLYVVGVFRKEESDVYYVLKINKKKSNLSVTSVDYFADYESLNTKIDSKIPMLLVIDGKGVVNKKIDLKNETDVDWVKKLDYKTIHFLSYNSGENTFYSICRQSVTDEIVERFQKGNFQIVDLYIGSIVSALLNSTLKKTKLFSSTSVLSFEEEILSDVVKNENVNENVSCEFGNNSLSQFHLPLYAAGVHFFTQHPSITKNESLLINREEIFYKKAFNTFGVAMLVGFFILLLSSYISIQYFNSKNTELNLKNIYSNETFELVEKLEKQKEKKLEILSKTGISSSKFNSYYNYEIVKSTPNEIHLSAINVFPMMNELKSSKEVVFNSNTITISGNTRDEMIFNNWITTIKNFNWVKNLEINSIKKDKKNNTFFELTLTLKNV